MGPDLIDHVKFVLPHLLGFTDW